MFQFTDDCLIGIESLDEQHKHLFESWEICDYGWLCDWEKYWNRQLEWYYDDHYKRYYREPTPPDPKEEYRNWYHYYKMK